MYHFFSRQNSKHRNERVTLVGEFSNETLKIAAARCSKKDQFARKKGVKIAEGRLAKNRLVFSETMQDCSPKKFIEISNSLVGHVLETKEVFRSNISK